ncbi:unnamed protein product [Heterobilharzia americana]|nr:unnamed protein product [Heterobilharzia americana]
MAYSIGDNSGELKDVDWIVLSITSRSLRRILLGLFNKPTDYFRKGKKGEKGEIIQSRIRSHHNRQFQRYKRDQCQYGCRLYQFESKNKHVKRSSSTLKGESKHASDLLHNGSTNIDFDKQKILGVKIIHNINELKTIGSILPVGALVISEISNYHSQSIWGKEYYSYQFRSKMNYQMNQMNSLGLFMKTENISNIWIEMPVKFGHEVTFGIPKPSEEIYESFLSKTPSLFDTSRYEEKILFAFHPIPATGGSLSGWNAADKNCHETAIYRLGIPGFKAFLVDKNFSVERLIKWQYQHIPIINLDNQVILPKWRDFLYGVRSNTNAPLYDLNGMPDIHHHNKTFWLGDGVSFGCNEWTSNSPIKYGVVWSFGNRSQVEITYARCDTLNYLMCYKIVKFATASYFMT